MALTGRALLAREPGIRHHKPLLQATPSKRLIRWEGRKSSFKAAHFLRPFQGPGKSPSTVFSGSCVFVRIAEEYILNSKLGLTAVSFHCSFPSLIFLLWPDSYGHFGDPIQGKPNWEMHLVCVEWNTFM